MKKESKNNLIARYIVMSGIKECDNAIYHISLEELFDDNTIKYIRDNKEEIDSLILNDERVLDIELNDNMYDITYNWKYCLDDLGRKIYLSLGSRAEDLEFEDIENIAIDLEHKIDANIYKMVNEYFDTYEKVVDRHER